MSHTLALTDDVTHTGTDSVTHTGTDRQCHTRWHWQIMSHAGTEGQCHTHWHWGTMSHPLAPMDNVTTTDIDGQCHTLTDNVTPTDTDGQQVAPTRLSPLVTSLHQAVSDTHRLWATFPLTHTPWHGVCSVFSLHFLYFTQSLNGIPTTHHTKNKNKTKTHSHKNKL